MYHFTPQQVDEMEWWQIRAVLGEGTYVVHPESDVPMGRTARERGRPVQRDLIAEEMAYRQGRGPKPKPSAPDPAQKTVMAVARLAR